jgi:hypothetical protein
MLLSILRRGDAALPHYRTGKRQKKAYSSTNLRIWISGPESSEHLYLNTSFSMDKLWNIGILFILVSGCSSHMADLCSGATTFGLGASTASGWALPWSFAHEFSNFMMKKLMIESMVIPSGNLLHCY